MVSVDGNIKPFRIGKADLIQLASNLLGVVKNLHTMKITVGRYSESMQNVSSLTTFLDDPHLPKVTKDLTLWIHASPTVHLYFGFDISRYVIGNARDMSEAKQIEDIVLTFFDRHQVSRICSPWFALMFAAALGLASVLESANVARYLIFGTELPYFPFAIHFVILLFSVTFFMYIVWSFVTSNTPRFSFYNVLFYTVEPRSSSTWALAVAIVVEIAVGIALMVIPSL